MDTTLLENRYYRVEAGPEALRIYFRGGEAGERLVLFGDPGEGSPSGAVGGCAWRPAGEGLAGTLRGDGWRCELGCTLVDRPLPAVRLERCYHFERPWSGALAPGFRLPDDPAIRYTYSLINHDVPLASARPARLPVDWAVPLPFHLWRDEELVGVYGLDKRESDGTIDFRPPEQGEPARLNVYYPETGRQGPGQFDLPVPPGTCTLEAASRVRFVEWIAVRVRRPGDEPFHAAVRLATELATAAPPRPADLTAAAARIAAFYDRCRLWEPDAFGPGAGWFSNMWVHVAGGTPAKRGEMSGYFDLGWGEGIMPEFCAGAVRHWRRTGDDRLLNYVDVMARSIPRFRCDSGAYHDRSDGARFGDFLMDVLPGLRIWSHSLGHSADQLLRLYLEFPDYPRETTRRAWREMAESAAAFFAARQTADGDICDIYDRDDREANPGKRRIPARVAVAGLWARMAELTGERSWLERAERLVRQVAGEIDALAIYGQMIDGVSAPEVDFIDGEAAYYLLEGLIPVYAATRDEQCLKLCRRAAAFGIAWTYWYDLPTAHEGVARGGQCCRMPDTPLLYPIGPAKAVPLLLDLAGLTGDAYFRRMAFEMVNFIGHWVFQAPGKPWDGGMVHAMGQYNSCYWGPAFEGQIDTGMATGNSLAAIETYLERV